MSPKEFYFKKTFKQELTEAEQQFALDHCFGLQDIDRIFELMEAYAQHKLEALNKEQVWKDPMLGD